MKSFFTYLTEEAEGEKLKHIHHAEDRPLLHGNDGFEHAHGALQHAHEHMAAGKHSNDLTMKYDGSPAVVFGHHPENKKFFVASKSAFNKNPKINYSHEDIDRNHGHAPGLAHKLHVALDHLHKVTPKKGVYQGDLMHSNDDLKHHGDKVSFTPNTITYTAHGEEAKKIKHSRVGVVVHTQYHGKDIHHMSASSNPDYHNFGHHPDVWHRSAEHDTSKIRYPESSQKKFHEHMNAAHALHKEGGHEMYHAIERHSGDGGHLSTYINKTVRTGETPTTKGFKEHITSQYEKAASKLKSEKGQTARREEGKEHVGHVDANKEHYDRAFKMHQHLQKAKNILVKHLESHEGGLEHHIDGKKSKPEGFVINHTHNGKTEPTKLVNRAEFARANLLKVRK